MMPESNLPREPHARPLSTQARDGVTTVSRRTVVAGAAWTAPLIVITASAPAFATSGATTLTATSPSASEFSEDTVAERLVTATLLDGDGAPLVGLDVMFDLSDPTWLRLTASFSTTDLNGLAVIGLQSVPGATPPMPGAAPVILTARHGNRTVTWAITYRPFSAVATGGASLHSLGLSGGNVYAWGRNTSGELGDGSLVSRTSPVAVRRGEIPNGVTITAVAAADNHSLALGSDGAVYAWGANYSGELGDGSRDTRTSPVAVRRGEIPNGVTITAVAAGGGYSLALGSDGRVYAWGRNDLSQLGDGTNERRTVPVTIADGEIPTGVTVKNISTSANHSLALGTDGTIYAWGWNNPNTIGDGPDSNVPVRIARGAIPPGTTVEAISAGVWHNVVLGDDGHVYVWGSNAEGQLGDGTSTNQNSPVALDRSALPPGTTFTAIAAGAFDSLALGADGKVYGWGILNSLSTVPGAAPTGDIPPGATITSIFAGQYHSLVLSDGALAYAWGWGEFGALGNGGSGDQPSPVKVNVAP